MNPLYLFKGRINRRNFLFGIFFSILLVLLYASLLGFIGRLDEKGTILEKAGFIILIAFGYSLYVRRLHDLGKSGLFSLLLIIPVVNTILFLYLVLFRGENKENHYGEPPIPKLSLRQILTTR